MRGRRILSVVVAALGFAGLAACSVPPAPVASAVAAPGSACVLIDTDFDIDDMMAIPMLLPNKHVAAIVTTEGVSRPGPGASALARLLATPGLVTAPPVIVGASADPGRGYTPPSFVAPLRVSMERANDLLRVPLAPVAADHPFADDVVKAVADCAHITVMTIGPWTSFAAYGPKIADRIDMVVAQGRAAHSAAEGDKGQKSFNCAFDHPSCEAVVPLLASLHTSFVDVPGDEAPGYGPDMPMLDGLRPDGLPGAIKAALLSNIAIWAPGHLAKGNKSLFWDQSAALYILQPELFNKAQDHYEAAIPVEQFRKIWVADVNGR